MGMMIISLTIIVLVAVLAQRESPIETESISEVENDKVICPSCGRQVKPKAFCPFCGTKLS